MTSPEQEHRPERPGAVTVMRAIAAAGQVLALRPVRRAVRNAARRPAWPVHPGGYVIGDPSASVAVCTLSDAGLAEQAAALPGVAIAGRLHTANLGIERIIANVTANPGIRFLLLCGRDSPLFQPGDALLALAANGTGPQRRIRGTAGYMPLLNGVSPAAVQSFRRQVEVADHRGETSLAALHTLVAELAARDPGPFTAPGPAAGAGQATKAGGFTEIRPGGRRRDPLGYDPAGYFVISLDPGGAKIAAEHYRADHTPAHRMRGTSAEAMLAGLLREGLISQPSHAGYLGAELAKAETAIRLGLRYEQDKPLRARDTPRRNEKPQPGSPA
jgi:tetrahydromethanopterin S-methyltransferase subunit A